MTGIGKANSKSERCSCSRCMINGNGKEDKVLIVAPTLSCFTKIVSGLMTIVVRER